MGGGREVGSRGQSSKMHKRDNEKDDLRVFWRLRVNQMIPFRAKTVMFKK